MFIIMGICYTELFILKNSYKHFFTLNWPMCSNACPDAAEHRSQDEQVT